MIQFILKQYLQKIGNKEEEKWLSLQQLTDQQKKVS